MVSTPIHRWKNLTNFQTMIWSIYGQSKKIHPLAHPIPLPPLQPLSTTRNWHKPSPYSLCARAYRRHKAPYCISEYWDHYRANGLTFTPVQIVQVLSFLLCTSIAFNNIQKTTHNKVVWQIHRLLLSHSSTRDTFLTNVDTHLNHQRIQSLHGYTRASAPQDNANALLDLDLNLGHYHH